MLDNKSNTQLLEEKAIEKIMSIIENKDGEGVIGRRGILIPLKKAIIQNGDIQNVIDIVASDPALAAHMLWRTNSAHSAINSSKHKTLKDCLIALGQTNIYRYAFTFYLKEMFDELEQPYRKLCKGYWTLTETIAEDTLELLENSGITRINADDLQTLSLFSVFGQVVALSAFAYLEKELYMSVPLSTIKTVIDKEQQSISIAAFKSFGLDDELTKQFLIAYNVIESNESNSTGSLLRIALSKRNLN